MSKEHFKIYLNSLDLIDEWGDKKRLFKAIKNENIYPVKEHDNFNINCNDGQAVKCAGCGEMMTHNHSGYFCAYIKFNSPEDVDLFCLPKCFPDYDKVLELRHAKWRVTEPLQFKEELQHSLIHKALWRCIINPNKYKFQAIKKKITITEIKELIKEECISITGHSSPDLSYNFFSPMNVRVAGKDKKSTLYKGQEVVDAFIDLLKEDDQYKLF